MELVRTISEVRERIRQARAGGRTVGFVPTMGYLHDGHVALIEAARRAGHYTVVSIFVNPLQFGPQEDYERYPRDLERDARICRQAGVDLVFAPSVEEMYPAGRSRTFVEVTELTDGLCGRFRPGHFRGVATVVTKLFHIVQPDVAYFGQKDAQQVRVIQQMVADLDFPVQIEVVPTVREPDGLAMSSRNSYLSPEERRAATVLYRALKAAEALVAAGERDAERVRDAMRRTVEAEPLARLQYAEVVDWQSLRPVDTLRSETLLALAVYIGQTRLIDNLLLRVDDPPYGSSGSAHFQIRTGAEDLAIYARSQHHGM